MPIVGHRQAIVLVVVWETSIIQGNMACLLGNMLHNVGRLCQASINSLANVLTTRHDVGHLQGTRLYF